MHIKLEVLTFAMNVVPGGYLDMSILCPKSINSRGLWFPPNTMSGSTLSGNGKLEEVQVNQIGVL